MSGKSVLIEHADDSISSSWMQGFKDISRRFQRMMSSCREDEERVDLCRAVTYRLCRSQGKIIDRELQAPAMFLSALGSR